MELMMLGRQNTHNITTSAWSKCFEVGLAIEKLKSQKSPDID